MKEALDKYKDKLRRLHAMQAAGAGDSDAADAIRDEMDDPWYKMTEAEEREAGFYSEGLYVMTDHSAIVIETESEV